MIALYKAHDATEPDCRSIKYKFQNLTPNYSDYEFLFLADETWRKTWSRDDQKKKTGKRRKHFFDSARDARCNWMWMWRWHIQNWEFPISLKTLQFTDKLRNLIYSHRTKQHVLWLSDASFTLNYAKKNDVFVDCRRRNKFTILFTYDSVEFSSSFSFRSSTKK